MKLLISTFLHLVLMITARGLRAAVSKKSTTSTKSKYSLSGMNRATEFVYNKKASATAGHLSVHVKGVIIPGESSSQQFYCNTLMNARNSILEDGISRFDVLNRIDNNSEFLLVEVYNSENGPSDHKLTAHYNSWRDNVADLMHQPRSAVKYTTLFPPRSNWKTDASAGTIDEKSFMKSVPWTQAPFTIASGIFYYIPQDFFCNAICCYHCSETSYIHVRIGNVREFCHGIIDASSSGRRRGYRRRGRCFHRGFLGELPQKHKRAGSHSI